MGMDMNIKWGVIGCGGIADRRTIPGMMKADNAELIAVMDTNPEAAARVGQKYGVGYVFQNADDLLALNQVEAVNIATYIGSVRGGAAGAACATLGVVLPSFLIILAIARCYKKFKSSKIVAGLMSGLKPAVIGLIAAAVLTVGKTVFLNSATPTGFPATVSDWFRTVSSALVFVLALFACRKKLHPILMILIAAALGIAFGLLGEMLVA